MLSVATKFILMCVVMLSDVMLIVTMIIDINAMCSN
jgi:hypothetical protein